MNITMVIPRVRAVNRIPLTLDYVNYVYGGGKSFLALPDGQVVSSTTFRQLRDWMNVVIETDCPRETTEALGVPSNEPGIIPPSA